MHFSIQREHVHLVVEAADGVALSKGVSGLMIRIARYVNDLLRRRGRLWADRFHDHALKTPREVRNAIAYVLGNARKHARATLPAGIDPYSSAAWFDGFREWRPDAGVPPPFFEDACSGSDVGEWPTASDFAPRTWLCKFGWRHHGLITIAGTPSALKEKSNATDG